MNRQILKLAVPSILANITIPLVGLVDTAIVGHISDSAAIGGIAVGTMLFDLLYWNFGFLRVGTSGMTAQAFGADNRQECAALLTRSLGIAAAGAALILLLQWLFVTAVLALMPCSAEVADFSRRYFFIRIWAAPATLALMAFKGWFIGMQDTVSPMVCDIVVNVLNMVASYALAVHTPLGAIGVAHGTLIAQYVGLLTAVVLLFVKYRSVLVGTPIGAILRDIAAAKKLIRLNTDLFIRSLCFMAVYVGYTVIASSFGNTELAVSAILMKLFMLFSYFVDGFAYAGEALVGRYIGAADNSRLTQVVRQLFVWSLAVGLFFTLLYAVLGQNSIRMMTSDPVVLAASHPYLGWLVAMPLISTLAFMWDGIYVGATAGTAIRDAMIWAAVAFVAAYLLTCRVLGPQALYIAYFAHLIARTAYLSWRWRHTLENVEQQE